MPPKSRKARRVDPEDLWDVKTLHELYGILYDGPIFQDFMEKRGLLMVPKCCERCGSSGKVAFRGSHKEYYWRWKWSFPRCKWREKAKNEGGHHPPVFHNTTIPDTHFKTVGPVIEYVHIYMCVCMHMYACICVYM